MATCGMGSDCYCGGAPHGCGGDHCPWCGADWKGTHSPECEKFEGCNHDRRNSHPKVRNGKFECANCYEELSDEDMELWWRHDWWISKHNCNWDEDLVVELKEKAKKKKEEYIASIVHHDPECKGNGVSTMMLDCMICKRELLCFSCNFGKSGGYGRKDKEGNLDDDPKIPRGLKVCKQCVEDGEYDKLPDLPARGNLWIH